MKNMRIKKILLCICTILTCCLIVACGKDDTPKTYTVTITTDYGKAMEEIEIRIYTDATKEDIVAGGKTDEDGKFSFQSKNAVGNIIYFEGDFTGYAVEEYYEIHEQDTNILLKTQFVSEDSLEGVTFELGDVFADMCVETSDGKQYLISDLLKEKKAVVINFWYLNCQPCKLEFPYLQEAYEEYKDVIEVLAVNPVDGTNEKISAFQTEKGFTFPMAVCDNEWESYMEIQGFPTTVVIDRYGIIGYIHTGSVTDKETFTKIFEFFTRDDYEQTTIRRLDELE